MRACLIISVRDPIDYNISVEGIHFLKPSIIIDSALIVQSHDDRGVSALTMCHMY